MGFDNTFLFIKFLMGENQEKGLEKTHNPRKVLARIFGRELQGQQDY